nr:guanylate-binding protein 4 [Quercus suber]
MESKIRSLYWVLEIVAGVEAMPIVSVFLTAKEEVGNRSLAEGIWVWRTPIELDIDGVRIYVFYLDTEGFESIGKSNVYDDRIFVLATVMSSVLIYNLPETIREADISRLSFAVELAEEFYGRHTIQKGKSVQEMVDEALRHVPNNDEGKSVQEMVDEALRHVPNNDGKFFFTILALNLWSMKKKKLSLNTKKGKVKEEREMKRKLTEEMELIEEEYKHLKHWVLVEAMPKKENFSTGPNGG